MGHEVSVMRAAELLDERNPHSRVSLELRQLQRVYYVPQVAGDHVGTSWLSWTIGVGSAERLVEVLDQVVGMLQAYGQTEKIVGQACARAVSRTAGLVLNETLRLAKARGVDEHPHVAAHGGRQIAPAADLQRDDATESARQLLRGKVMLRV
jgi:hypothetical protein